jgi:hypothetical protein
MNPDIPHPKARGEWAEMRFMARAAEHRLCVAKPWGDMAPYDFAVEHNGRFLRVQEKCTRWLPHPSRFFEGWERLVNSTVLVFVIPTAGSVGFRCVGPTRWSLKKRLSS